MTLQELVDAYTATRAPGWLVLTPTESLECGLSATVFYAAYGDIASLSPRVPGEGDPDPVTDLSMIDSDVELSVGEWAVIKPLFVLYIERENAFRLEASRAAGLEVYGRQVSEIAGDIERMEAPEGLPARAFASACYTV